MIDWMSAVECALFSDPGFAMGKTQFWRYCINFDSIESLEFSFSLPAA